MKTLADFTDHDIRVADWINAVDKNSTHWETLWGLDEPAMLPTAEPQRIIEFQMAEDDHIGLLNAIDRIEQVKGHLPPRILALRQVLKQATAAANSPA